MKKNHITLKDFGVSCIKRFFLIMIPTIVAVITVPTFFSNKLEDNLKQIGFLGTAVIFLICMVLSLTFESYAVIKKVNAEENDVPDCSVEKIINDIFRISALSIRFPEGIPLFNIHYYSYCKIGTEEYLHKERAYGYEAENLSVDYLLEQCRLDASNIVMCEAYKSNCIIFKNLPNGHVMTYDSDIRNFIDEGIKWVSACPVWRDDNTVEKIGVVVMFGFEKFIEDHEMTKINALKNLNLEISKCLSYLLDCKKEASEK